MKRPELQRDYDLYNLGHWCTPTSTNEETWTTKGLRRHTKVLGNCWNRGMKRPELQRDYDSAKEIFSDIPKPEWRDLNYKGITTAFYQVFLIHFLLLNEETWTKKGLRPLKPAAARVTAFKLNEETWTTKGLRPSGLWAQIVLCSTSNEETWTTKGLRLSSCR